MGYLPYQLVSRISEPSTVPPRPKQNPYTLIDQDLFRLINMINKSTNRITPWTHQAADDLSCQKK